MKVVDSEDELLRGDVAAADVASSGVEGNCLSKVHLQHHITVRTYAEHYLHLIFASYLIYAFKGKTDFSLELTTCGRESTGIIFANEILLQLA